MKHLYLINVPLILSFCCCNSFAQNTPRRIAQQPENTSPPKQIRPLPYGDPRSSYEDSEIRFSYLAGWSRSEQRKPSGKTWVLTRRGLRSQVSVTLRDAMPNPTPEALRRAQAEIVSRYEESVRRYVEENGGHVEERTQVSTRVGEEKAEGVRLRGMMQGGMVSMEVYTLVRKGRVIALGLMYPDSEKKEAGWVWDTLRERIEVL